MNASGDLTTWGKQPGGEDLGRVRFSYVVFDIGAFRTATLRNIALTAPYFHDGSARTLAEVVKFYNEGGKANVAREWDLAPLGLTEDEQRDLVTFLESLTGQLPGQEVSTTGDTGRTGKINQAVNVPPRDPSAPRG